MRAKSTNSVLTVVTILSVANRVISMMSKHFGQVWKNTLTG